MGLEFLIRSVRGIPVLMYHQVQPDPKTPNEISPDALREQWTYLRDEGYRPLRMAEFLEVFNGKAPLKEKMLLITFDDGYRDNLEHAYPLAKELNFPFTIFLIAGTLDGNQFDEAQPGKQKLGVEELRQMQDLADFGLHGYLHEDFSKHSVNDLIALTRKSIDTLERSGLRYRKVLAYPYGARPAELGELKSGFLECGLEAGFRIGNRIAAVPGGDIYEIPRIDVRGNEPLKKFGIRLRKGKLKPF